MAVLGKANEEEKGDKARESEPPAADRPVLLPRVHKATEGCLPEPQDGVCH